MVKANKQIIVCRIISILLLILWIWFIFGNSSEVAEVSSRKSGMIAAWFEGIITERVIRKLAHIFEYTILGIILGFCVKSYYKINKPGIFTVLFSGFIIATCDELIQLTADGRSAQISDVFIDFSGVFIGLLLFCWIILFRKNHINRV